MTVPEPCTQDNQDNQENSHCVYDDYDDDCETIRAKWMLDGCETIDQIIEVLESTIDYYKDLKNKGYVLKEAIVDDYGFIHVPK